ncbi:MAG: hypothetical protein OEW08_10690 [Gammaproteobacteria bacterium]|nr:hypothetical protein [Gammaproteobacteria bacterium]
MDAVTDANTFRPALAAIVLGCGLLAWPFSSSADDDAAPQMPGSTVNYIAMHDRDSSQYRQDCLNCHSNVLTEAPVALNVVVTNPNLNQQPRSRSAHGTMLAKVGVKPGERGSSRQCQFCHRSVYVVEGPPMPQDPLKGGLRRHVDPLVCALCHGPKTGGQPNSPGPQFYAVGLNALVTDGVRLYDLFCAGCHNRLARSEVRGESASEILKEINENEGGMGPLRVLTPTQIQAIANALR